MKEHHQEKPPKEKARTRPRIDLQVGSGLKALNGFGFPHQRGRESLVKRVTRVRPKEKRKVDLAAGQVLLSAPVRPKVDAKDGVEQTHRLNPIRGTKNRMMMVKVEAMAVMIVAAIGATTMRMMAKTKTMVTARTLTTGIGWMKTTKPTSGVQRKKPPRTIQPWIRLKEIPSLTLTQLLDDQFHLGEEEGILLVHQDHHHGQGRDNQKYHRLSDHGSR